VVFHEEALYQVYVPLPLPFFGFELPSALLPKRVKKNWKPFLQ